MSDFQRASRSSDAEQSDSLTIAQHVEEFSRKIFTVATEVQRVALESFDLTTLRENNAELPEEQLVRRVEVLALPDDEGGPIAEMTEFLDARKKYLDDLENDQEVVNPIIGDVFAAKAATLLADLNFILKKLDALVQQPEFRITEPVEQTAMHNLSEALYVAYTSRLEIEFDHASCDSDVAVLEE